MFSFYYVIEKHRSAFSFSMNLFVSVADMLVVRTELVDVIVTWHQFSLLVMAMKKVNHFECFNYVFRSFLCTI